jgi:hypothetical protein
MTLQMCALICDNWEECVSRAPSLHRASTVPSVQTLTNGKQIGILSKRQLVGLPWRPHCSAPACWLQLLMHVCHELLQLPFSRKQPLDPRQVRSPSVPLRWVHLCLLKPPHAAQLGAGSERIGFCQSQPTSIVRVLLCRTRYVPADLRRWCAYMIHWLR